MRNESYAIDAIRLYECAMSDPWRHDFCDSLEEACDADDYRFETMIDEIVKHLECERVEAVEFYECNRW